MVCACVYACVPRLRPRLLPVEVQGLHDGGVTKAEQEGRPLVLHGANLDLLRARQQRMKESLGDWSIFASVLVESVERIFGYA